MHLYECSYAILQYHAVSNSQFETKTNQSLQICLNVQSRLNKPTVITLEKLFSGTKHSQDSCKYQVAAGSS